jgi:hypothetical protein
VLPVPAEVQQHAVCLLLSVPDCCNAAQGQRSSLMQPAVGSGSAEHTALVIGCTALQHRQQAGVRQRQKQTLIDLHSFHPARQHKQASSRGMSSQVTQSDAVKAQ